MGKNHCSRRGSAFALPRKTVRKPPQKPRPQPPALLRPPDPAPPKAPEPERPPGPSKKEKKRLAARKHLLSAGKLEQTELGVKQLMKTGAPVMRTLLDCQDEAELRDRFHRQGTAGHDTKLFTASKYKFKFLLSKDGMPVAQIHRV
ncbi:unnamed protein product [Prorocentrum cordatum]|uniref:Non-specific serine/threonine protein kinase n=1 Tax=Prorocentrum cordatum TaxID=2364126 RepID=A0ABN9SXK4_9DINO|nr:unnamed protein product [Polarella glacialis]